MQTTTTSASAYAKLWADGDDEYDLLHDAFMEGNHVVSISDPDDDGRIYVTAVKNGQRHEWYTDRSGDLRIGASTWLSLTHPNGGHDLALWLAGGLR